MAVQSALVPFVIARLGHPRFLGLVIDWTMFAATLPPRGTADALPGLAHRRAPRRSRFVPLLQLAYDRDRLPKEKSQNRLEQDALLAVVEALPAGVRPVVLADRGFARAAFFAWLNARGLDYVVRVKKGTCLTERGRRRRPALEARRGRARAEPTALGTRRPLRPLPRPPCRGDAQRGLCWRVSKSRAKNPHRKLPKEPWYLPTSLKDAASAASWYWQRGWSQK